MGETPGLIGCARKVVDESRKMLDHGVIIGCIIAGDTKHLTNEVSFNFHSVQQY